MAQALLGEGTYACSSGGASVEALRAGCGSPLSRGCTGGSEPERGWDEGSAPSGAVSPSSVLRNNAASGPSRMLARLALAIG